MDDKRFMSVLFDYIPKASLFAQLFFIIDPNQALSMALITTFSSVASSRNDHIDLPASMAAFTNLAWVGRDSEEPLDW